MQTLSCNDLIKRNQTKIDLIRHSSDGNYEKDLLPLIERMASWFNSMPLNSTYYEEPGGAFRCCIESAYFVMRQAKDAIFTSELTSEKRRALEPEFRYAAFIASMVSWADEPFRHYDFICNGQTFNAAVNADFTAFASSSPSYVIKSKDGSQPESRQRTIMMASKLIIPLMNRLTSPVQDVLFSAINPERRPQNSETVLQRVVRKGLGQAEEVERKSKNLYVVPVDRTVSSAFMLEQVEKDRTQVPNKEEEKKDLPEAAIKKGETQPSIKPDKPNKPEEKQIALPLSASGSLNYPQQYIELFQSIALDISAGTRDIKEMKWTKSGLQMPKKFFGGKGRPVPDNIQALRSLGIIIGTDTLNILVIPAFGEMLLARPTEETS